MSWWRAAIESGTGKPLYAGFRCDCWMPALSLSTGTYTGRAAGSASSPLDAIWHSTINHAASAGITFACNGSRHVVDAARDAFEASYQDHIVASRVVEHPGDPWAGAMGSRNFFSVRR